MAITVTSKIKELLKSRDKKILSADSYIQQLLTEVKKEVVAELAAMPTDSYSAYYLRQSLASIERHLQTFESAASRELGAGIAETWAGGTELLPAVLQAAGEPAMFSGYGLAGNVVDTLKEYAFGRIKSLSSDAYTKIKGELTLGILGQKTPQAIAAEIAAGPVGPPRKGKPASYLPSAGIFKTIQERAEVITGLEMGRAFSIATDRSITQAADTLTDLLRMWLHAGHPRLPRVPHLLMHGQTRKPGAPFYQAKGGKVMYPRDPQAPISECIRCGCTHVPYMAAWGDAKEFAAQWDQTQYALWFKEKKAA